MVRFGFATSKDILDRVVNIMRADREVSLSEVFSKIAWDWGMDQNGRFLHSGDLSREQLQNLYAHHAGNIRWMAETLGVDRGTIYYHLRRCGIDRLPVEERKRRPPRKRKRSGKTAC
jgi:transcriptional regulator of acetoin/glycerol metabolism